MFSSDLELFDLEFSPAAEALVFRSRDRKNPKGWQHEARRTVETPKLSQDHQAIYPGGGVF